VTVPAYQQLAESLLSQIGGGVIAVGDRLPTEEQLCATHGLSRGTVRQALGRLTRLGMINRRAGIGTVVIAAAPVGGYQPVAQSAADIAALAAETKLVHPRTGEIWVDAALARRIGTRAGTKWTLLEGARIRRGTNEHPRCWSEHYLRGDLQPAKLLRSGFAIGELDGQLVEQTISATLLDPQMAQALDAEPASAALVITRRHRDPRGRLASVGIHTHPADRYEISTAFRPGQP
jgi:GntR family transcriptional regulator